ncbi:MAG: hypothetical protein M3362_23955, partial [Acidobacteriota bacterium]|nr:hypothetical protein [Acidobacteriota bacterium]
MPFLLTWPLGVPGNLPRLTPGFSLFVLTPVLSLAFPFTLPGEVLFSFSFSFSFLLVFVLPLAFAFALPFVLVFVLVFVFELMFVLPFELVLVLTLPLVLPVFVFPERQAALQASKACLQ